MEIRRIQELAKPRVAPKGTRMHISTYLPGDVAEVFTKLAAAEGMTQAHAARAAISSWMIATAKRRKAAKA